MNYLAHQYLSFDQPELMLGNFMADTLRSGEVHQHAPQVKMGIALHRFIDHYTDSHHLVLESRKLLYPYFGKYAQVVQDVFYDHFLARAWSNYHSVALPDFAAKVYHTLKQQESLLNERARRTLHHMSLHNWLVGYALEEGIDRALKGMASRARFESGMEHAIPALNAHDAAMEAHFTAFMPSLQSAVEQEFAHIARV